MFEIKFLTGRKMTRCTRQLRDYDPQLHDIVLLLSDMCEKMRRHTDCDFYVSGFGQSWPVSLDPDLHWFLSEIEYILDWLNSAEDKCYGYSFGANQGFDVGFEFSKVDDHVLIKCWSALENLQPKIEVEEISKAALNSQLTDFLQSFIDVARKVDPRITNHPWFVEWLNTPSIKARLSH